MRINNNLMAMNTHRQLGVASNGSAKSMEKLSSGLRINKAGDDAAGLAISEKMRAQVRGLNQASSNAQDGISMIQTAEGALNETHAILQRMREITVQASNDTNTGDDRKAIGDELVQLKDEINRISQTTKFNGKGVLDGSLTTSLGVSGVKVGAAAAAASAISKVDVSKAAAGTVYTLTAGTAADELTATATIAGKTVSETVKLGANSQTVSFASLGISFEVAGTNAAADIRTGLVTLGNVTTAAGDGSASFLIGSNGTAQEKLNVAFEKMDATTLGSGGANQVANKVTDNTSVDTKAKAEALITVLDDAIKGVSTQRSSLGAAQNRLDHTIKNLNTSSENLQAAEARIRDVDMAKEMMDLTKNNILTQAAQAMLAQANQAPQGVLQLLR